MAQDLQRSDAPLYRLEAIDFGRRMAVEKELEKTESAPQPNAVFDESSNFLIFATLLGIKVIIHLIIFVLNYHRLAYQSSVLSHMNMIQSMITEARYFYCNYMLTWLKKGLCG